MIEGRYHTAWTLRAFNHISHVNHSVFFYRFPTVAVSIGFAVHQEVHTALHFGFSLYTPVWSLPCILLITSKSKYIFFKPKKVNKHRLLGV
jgi:hypothetical protein